MCQCPAFSSEERLRIVNGIKPKVGWDVGEAFVNNLLSRFNLFGHCPFGSVIPEDDVYRDLNPV